MISLEVEGFSFSVDFDEEVLEVTQVEPVFERPDGKPWDFMRLHLNNENNIPGNGGIDEGYVCGSVMFSFRDINNNLPASSGSPVLTFHVRVRPEAQASSTEVRFLDGAHPPDRQPVSNLLCAWQMTHLPEAFNSFLFINGYVEVLPEMIAFVRGDSNGDGEVNISDALTTLGYLFLGSGDPACFDAADTDDNGYLDIGDPIYALTYLFVGGSPIPPPYPEEDADPTEDSMDCLTRG